MQTDKPCSVPPWALLLPPAATLILCGLLLHPLALDEALALLWIDGADFLLTAGLAARIPLLTGGGLLLGLAILLLLALFRSVARRLRYHSGMLESRKRARLSFP